MTWALSLGSNYSDMTIYTNCFILLCLFQKVLWFLESCFFASGIVLGSSLVHQIVMHSRSEYNDDIRCTIFFWFVVVQGNVSYVQVYI